MDLLQLQDFFPLLYNKYLKLHETFLRLSGGTHRLQVEIRNRLSRSRSTLLPPDEHFAPELSER